MSPLAHVYRFASTGFGWVVFIAGCAVWGAIVIPLTLLLSPFSSAARRGFRRLTSRALRFYVQTLGFLKVEVHGADRRLAGRRVVVANHQSWLDPIVMLGLEPGISGPAQRYLFRVPVLRQVLSLLGFIHSDPTDAAAFAAIRARVREDPDAALLFLPEGTRSPTGGIGEFQRGAFRVAVEAGLPVQPVVIEGLFDVLPRGALIAQAAGRPRVVVSYLDPVPPPAAAKPRVAARQLAADVREQMVIELERLGSRRSTGSSRPH